MIVIATQKVNINNRLLTVELLKHDHRDDYYIYSSDDLAVTDMINAETAINVYSSYAVMALSKH